MIDARRLWQVFPAHQGELYACAPRLRLRIDECWWTVITGERHCDLNLGGLGPGASEVHAGAVVREIGEDLPTVVMASQFAAADCSGPLVGAGFERVGLTEALMWCEPPARAPITTDVQVRPIESDNDLAVAQRIIAEAHGVPMASLAVLYSRELLDGGVVSGWLAERDGQPAGTAWFSKVGGLLGVLEMMTVPDHRRRGVGGQMLRAGMSVGLHAGAEGAFLWSSPIGRGVYEAAGFQPVDEMTMWGRGADDLLGLIGQHKPDDA